MAQCGRVCPGAGTGLDTHVKLIVKGGRSTDMRGPVGVSGCWKEEVGSQGAAHLGIAMRIHMATPQYLMFSFLLTESPLLY